MLYCYRKLYHRLVALHILNPLFERTKKSYSCGLYLCYIDTCLIFSVLNEKMCPINEKEKNLRTMSLSGFGELLIYV